MSTLRSRFLQATSSLVLAILAAACAQQAPTTPPAASEEEGQAAPERATPASSSDSHTSAAESPSHAAPVDVATARPRTEPAKPAPVAPPSAPAAVTLAIPAGTELELELLDSVSSGTSQAGDPFRARLTQDLMANGRRVAAAGTEFQGTVSEVVPLKKFGGQPKLTLAFESMKLANGQSVPVTAYLVQEGKKQAGGDAAKIGGAAAAGAIIGHQVDDDKGKAIGAIVGGAIGTAVAAKTGKEVEIAAGSTVVVTLESEVRVRL